MIVQILKYNLLLITFMLLMVICIITTILYDYCIAIIASQFVTETKQLTQCDVSYNTIWYDYLFFSSFFCFTLLFVIFIIVVSFKIIIVCIRMSKLC